MKKNYSTPEFMLVALDSTDIVCTSETMNRGTEDLNDVNAGAKRRNIWEE